VVAQLG